MALSAGTRLGPYEILACIGAGGMGEVYRAHDSRLNRDVAIKVLPETFAKDPARLARFEREARLLASVNHPAIRGLCSPGENGSPVDGNPGERAGAIHGTAPRGEVGRLY